MKTLTLALTVAAALAAGCVEQKLTITSEPSDALVYLSGEEIGRTPVTIDFTYVGDYNIVLRQQDYQTLKTHAWIKPTAYEIPGLDLFAELIPYTYRDHRYLHFKLEKLVVPSDEQLIDSARELRQKNTPSADTTPKPPVNPAR